MERGREVAGCFGKSFPLLDDNINGFQKSFELVFESV